MNLFSFFTIKRVILTAFCAFAIVSLFRLFSNDQKKIELPLYNTPRAENPISNLTPSSENDIVHQTETVEPASRIVKGTSVNKAPATPVKKPLLREETITKKEIAAVAAIQNYFNQASKIAFPNNYGAINTIFAEFSKNRTTNIDSLIRNFRGGLARLKAFAVKEGSPEITLYHQLNIKIVSNFVSFLEQLKSSKGVNASMGNTLVSLQQDVAQANNILASITAQRNSFANNPSLLFGICIPGIVCTTCGDNALDTGEECDDGNTTNGDGCSDTCALETVAGSCNNNGAIDPGEQCDDGNATNGDGCSSTCQIESGGLPVSTTTSPSAISVVVKYIKGFVMKGVGTDNPVCPSKDVNGQLNIEGTQITQASVVPPDPTGGLTIVNNNYGGGGGGSGSGGGGGAGARCGNGIRESNEQCDDGNKIDNDTCNNACRLEIEPPCVGVRCDGGGMISRADINDSLVKKNQSSFTNITQSLLAFGICIPGIVCSTCGNSSPDTGEECDDGNTTNGDGCSDTCALETVAGSCNNNGAIDPGEQCDDGNATNGDGCSSTCQIESGGPVIPPIVGSGTGTVGLYLDEILWRFMCTFKDYQEKFTYDLTQAQNQQNRIELTSSLIDEIKAFELAKIEKAREDVNKLINETVKEMKDQPLVVSDYSGALDPIINDVRNIMRLKGLTVKPDAQIKGIGDCPWGVRVNSSPALGGGDCWVVKQSSRVVENLDNYLNEEPLAKARDAVMCLLAPWNHWPAPPIEPDMQTAAMMGTCIKGNLQYCVDDYNFGKALGVCSDEKYPNDVNRDTVINECSVQFICTYARQKAGLRPDMFSGPEWQKYYYKLCPSDREKEDIKRFALLSLIRKHHVLDTMPPEIWYYGPGIDPDWGGEIRADYFKDHAIDWRLDNSKCQLSGAPNDKTQPLCVPIDPYRTRGRCDFILENLLGSGGNPIEYLSTYKSVAGNPEGGNSSEFLQFNNLRIQDVLTHEARTFHSDLPLNLITKRSNYLFFSTDEQVLAQKERNDIDKVKRGLDAAVEVIVQNEKQKNTLKYATGAGIKPLQYLVGWNACADANLLSAGNKGIICSQLKSLYGGICDDVGGSCQGSGHFYFETDDIIAPAIFLVNKIAASIQAEFSLAMMAWKKEPESPGFQRALTCPVPACAQEGDYNCWEKKIIENEFYPKLSYGKDTRETLQEHTKCIFRAKNLLTQTPIGDIEIDPAQGKILNFPSVLPAPWEDLGKYLNLKDGFGDFIDNYCSAITTKEDCKERAYQENGGYPFCAWYPHEDSKILNYTGDGICRYAAKTKLVYDTDKPSDAYSDFDKGNRSAPDYIDGGQYFNRLYRESVQLFEKPMDQALLDWYEPENSCIRVPKQDCNDATKPQCINDTIMDVCRLKTCEEINALPVGKREMACKEQPSCTLQDRTSVSEPYCRHK